MNVRRLALISACSALSCSYPTFTFVEPSDATAPDTLVADTSVRPDSETSPEDTADSAVADTSVTDTIVTDTFVADTSVADTLVADTAKPDTKPPVDAPPLGFCATSTHFFCNDFDISATDPTFGWTSSNLQGTGAIKLDGTAKSAPRSLRTTITAPSSLMADAASVNQVLNAPAADSLTRFEADVMLDAASYPGLQGTLLMKVQRSGGNGFGFGIDPDGFYVELVGTGYHWFQPTFKPVGGTWFHVKMEGKLLITGGFTKVWVDGVLVADISGKSTAEIEGTSRSFVVGLYADSPIATYGVRYDNVTVDFP